MDQKDEKNGESIDDQTIEQLDELEAQNVPDPAEQKGQDPDEDAEVDLGQLLDVLESVDVTREFEEKDDRDIGTRVAEAVEKARADDEPLSMPRNKRNWAIVQITPELIKEFCLTRDMRQRVSDGLPADAKWISSDPNPRRSCIDIIFEHASFPETVEGEVLPILPSIKFERVADYNAKGGVEYRYGDIFFWIEADSRDLNFSGGDRDHFILKIGKWDDSGESSEVVFPDIFRMQRDHLVALRDCINTMLLAGVGDDASKLASTTDPYNWAVGGRHFEGKNLDEVAKELLNQLCNQPAREIFDSFLGSLKK